MDTDRSDSAGRSAPEDLADGAFLHPWLCTDLADRRSHLLLAGNCSVHHHRSAVLQDEV